MKAASYDELYGRTIRGYGIASVPMALIDYQRELGINFSELGVLTALFSFRFTPDEPYPSIRLLSELSGVPRSTIHDILSGLGTKQLIGIGHRVTADGFKTSNTYDLRPVLLRLIELIERDQRAGQSVRRRSRRKVPNGTARQTPAPVSGPPDTVAGSSRHPWPASPATVAGSSRPEIEPLEVDQLEVEKTPPDTSQNCTREAEPPAAPPPRRDAEPRPVEAVCRSLGLKLHARPYRLGAPNGLAAQLADYVGRHGLSAGQLEKITHAVLQMGPFRTLDEFWRTMDAYRLTYVQPNPQPASAIVPAKPSAAAVGRPLEAAGRRP